MSRCFPFPPPGYEKKARNDDVDSLTKEKHKEKKHKKDKKDKEKRESKERKDRERSKDTQREKKERKEKHKDKKDKDRDKDTKTSDDKRIEGRTEESNKEKLGENCQQAEEIKASKYGEELGRKFRDEIHKAEEFGRKTRDERGTGNQMVENFNGSSQKRIEGMGRATENTAKDKTKTSDAKRFEGRTEGYNKEKLGENIRWAEEIKNSKYMDELAKRFRDDSGTGNRMVENFNGTNQRRIEGMGRAMEDTKKKAAGKEENKDKQGNDKRTDRHGDRDDQKRSGNEMVWNLINTDHRRTEGMGGPMANDTEKKIEGKEKHKAKEGDSKRGEKHKEKDREEKRSKSKKDKKREKEKEKEKEKVEHKQNEQHRLIESGKKDQLSTLNIKPLCPPKDSEKSVAYDGNLKKRKEFEMNGFLHENDMRPNKLPRAASSSHLPMDNGGKLESCHFIPKADNKEHKVNGKIEAQPSSVNLQLSVSLEANEIVESSSRPPHPDFKYLNHILSVPKMEEWSDVDNQEWLFSGNNLQPKPKAGPEVEEAPRVWAEALQIESADVCALPYVIPY